MNACKYCDAWLNDDMQIESYKITTTLRILSKFILMYNYGSIDPLEQYAN